MTLHWLQTGHQGSCGEEEDAGQTAIVALNPLSTGYWTGSSAPPQTD